jgi:hypothetical protein
VIGDIGSCNGKAAIFRATVGVLKQRSILCQVRRCGKILGLQNIGYYPLRQHHQTPMKINGEIKRAGAI